MTHLLTAESINLATYVISERLLGGKKHYFVRKMQNQLPVMN
jgi:D-alanyl-D-alanine carboxypeptidase